MLYALDHELFQAFSILFLPIILVQVYLYFSHPNNAFAEVVWPFQMFFWQSLIRRCLHLVVLNKSSLFALMKSSLDCRLWQWHLSPGECSLIGWMLWKVFSLPWRGFSDHPPLLSFMDVQAFLCCWAHWCVLFFLECTNLLIWPLPNVPAISLTDLSSF